MRFARILTVLAMVLGSSIVPASLAESFSLAPGKTTSTKATLGGSIRNNQGTSICGLVLANGVFTFSCSPAGSYGLLDVPLDANGQITLFGFADGHFPFRATLTSGGTRDIVLTIANTAPPPPADNNRTRSERLVGGTWSMVYTILSTFTSRYTFTSVQASTATPGDYTAIGRDEFNNLVVGGYFSSNGRWAILDTSIIIDLFYVFDFIDDNRVSGCYYQISPPGSTNLGRCYNMIGTRFPPKIFEGDLPRDTREQQGWEALQLGNEVVVDSEVLLLYQRAREEAKGKARP